MTTDDLTKLAVFLSQTTWVETIGGPTCTGEIIEFVKGQTDDILKRCAEDIAECKKVTPAYEWGKSNCTNLDEYPQSTSDVISSDVESEVSVQGRWEYKMDSVLAAQAASSSLRREAEREGCSGLPYGKLSEARDLAAEIALNCGDIGKYGYNMEPCNSSHELEEKLNKEAAKELLSRCSHEAVLEQMAVRFSGAALEFQASMVEDVCFAAEDKDCLRDVDAILKRDKEGVKQLVLALERSEF